MLAVVRFRVPLEETDAFRAELAKAHDVLAGRPGYVEGRMGRNLDDPTLWVLTTQWHDVGAYRRALSSYDVKMTAPAVMAYAVTEPSAFEVLDARGPAADR
jgi:quinol monooxygenase YgiN